MRSRTLDAPAPSPVARLLEALRRGWVAVVGWGPRRPLFGHPCSCTARSRAWRGYDRDEGFRWTCGHCGRRIAEGDA